MAPTSAAFLGGRNVGIAPDKDLMVAAVLESETLRTSLERVVVALNSVLAQFEKPRESRQAGHRQYVAGLSAFVA